MPSTSESYVITYQFVGKAVLTTKRFMVMDLLWLVCNGRSYSGVALDFQRRDLVLILRNAVHGNPLLCRRRRVCFPGMETHSFVRAKFLR
jgi:hypothetical protein